jgi:hypothetical protein
MFKIIKFNDTLFKVDKKKFDEMERNAYYTNPLTKETVKDFLTIFEWLKRHGVVVKPKVE